MWCSIAAYAGLGAVTLGLLRVGRSRPYALVGWLWFVGTLVPVIGLVQVGSQAMADRYTYQPSVGLFIALCWGAADLWQAARPGLRPFLALGATAALSACLLLCHRQVGYWQNGTLLFQHTLAVTRPTSSTYLLLGDSYSQLNRYGKAEAAYRDGFRLQPDVFAQAAKLGYLQLHQGHWDEACAHLRQAVGGDQYNDPVLLSNFGFALNRAGQYNEAEDMIRRSLALRPDYALAHSNLADALLASGQRAPAITEYEKALALRPDMSPVLAQLSWLYSFADPEHDPQRGARALVLARRAVDLTEGRSLACLDALAAAEAAASNWPQAATVAQIAWQFVSRQPGAISDAVALRAERMEAYRAARWPQR